ncbi:MAG: hypothetical protein ABIR37_00240 [Candidatus Saccharimonadales bacterium]
MINSKELQAFWGMIEETLDEVPVVVASEDDDLRALFELQIVGSTDAVKPARAALIAAWETEQLYTEIQCGYGLSRQGMAAAIDICKKRVETEARAEMGWLD